MGATTDRGIGSLVHAMTGLAAAITPPPHSPPKPLATAGTSPPSATAAPADPTPSAPAPVSSSIPEPSDAPTAATPDVRAAATPDVPADAAPTPAAPAAADPSTDATDAIAATTPPAATATPSADPPSAPTDASTSTEAAPVPAPVPAPAPAPVALPVAAPAPAPAAAPPSNQTTNLLEEDSEAGYHARLQADALARQQRQEQNKRVQQEHPGMFLMGDYLKNFASTFNPKANTHPMPTVPGAGRPVSTAITPVAAAPAGAVAETSFAASSVSVPVLDAGSTSRSAGLEDPSTQPAPPAQEGQAPQYVQFPAYHIGVPQNAPARQGTSAIGSIVEELQARVEALTHAHQNASRHAVGLPLLPVLVNGHPADGLPPITSAASVDELDDAALTAWAQYYLGGTDGADLDRPTKAKAIKVSIGVPGA